MRLAAAIVCIMMLSGCNPRSTRQPEVTEPAVAGAPTDSDLSGMANSALQRLREAFDSGDCESIYAEASEVFHELEPKSRWLHDCDQLRFELGRWQSVTVRTADTPHGLLAHSGGVAVFAAGRYGLWTTWRFENGKAKLLALSLYGPGRQVVIPGPPLGAQPMRELMDPPPADARKSG